MWNELGKTFGSIAGVVVIITVSLGLMAAAKKLTEDIE